MNAWRKHCLWQASYLVALVATAATVLAMVLTGHSRGAGALAWVALGVYTLGLLGAAERRRRARKRVAWENRRDRAGRPLHLLANEQHQHDLKVCETIWRRS